MFRTQSGFSPRAASGFRSRLLRPALAQGLHPEREDSIVVNR